MARATTHFFLAFLVMLAASCRVADDEGIDDEAAAADALGATERLPANAFAPLLRSPGSPLAMGLATGRYYEDISENAADRMRDFAALGVRILRITIETRQSERTGKWLEYARIVDAARDAGIDVVAVVNWSSMRWPSDNRQPPDPMALDADEFSSSFVPHYLEAVDRVLDFLPKARFVEIWNEPDVYWFKPMATWNGACARGEAASRHAELLVRSYEHVDARRRARDGAFPLVLGFGPVRPDDRCIREAMFDAPPVKRYRAAHGRLPVDILAIHGYGTRSAADQAVLPWDAGYTYAGGTFENGIDELLEHRLDDGTRLVTPELPVWVTELGFGLNWLEQTPDPARAQADALSHVFTRLAGRRNVTAAFWYDWLDDPPESEENNRHGLRDSLASGRAPHPSYVAYQKASVARGDVTPPSGAMLAPRDGATVSRGAELQVTGWSIDADDTKAVRLALYVDGVRQRVRVEGRGASSFHARVRSEVGCAIAHSSRCPNVGFEVSLPVSRALEPGRHELALAAWDASGNHRVLGRATLDVQ